MKVSSEFLRYCLVGMVNTLAGISTAYILLNLLSQSYLISTTGAYIVGVIVSFSLNKIFTFKYCEDTHCFVLFFKFVLSMLPSYVVAYTLGWLVSKSVVWLPFMHNLVLDITSFFSIQETKVLDNFAVLVSMFIYLLLGFFVNKYFVFKKNKP